MHDALPTSSPPALWLDWCQVTRTPADRCPDAATLDRFRRQARPSQRVLHAISGAHGREHARPASTLWPSTGELTTVLEQISLDLASPDANWLQRLALRRLAFVAVLIAPVDQHGYDLTRAQVHSLSPAQFAGLRSSHAVVNPPAQCPACAVWRWLELLATNNGWAQASVRALGYERSSAEHVCTRPVPGGSDWRECTALVAGIDRWGWIDQHTALHPSSLSALIAQIRQLLNNAASPAASVPSPRPDPDVEDQSPARVVSAEEEREILRRADEQNRRVQELLTDFSL